MARRPTSGDRTAIYAISGADGVVRYIGKANNPVSRFKAHLREQRWNTPFYAWLRKHRSEAKCVVIEWCARDEWQHREKAHIAAHRVGGQLLNIADGGDAPKCSSSVCAENGRRNAHFVHSDPYRHRLWMLKIMLGQFLAAGRVTEATRSKMRYAAMKHPHLFGDWATA